MIHTTKLTHNHATYTDVYLFLKLYFSGAGTAEAEAIIYKDQAMTEGIGAIRLPDYKFEELGANPLDTLHTLTIAHLAQDGATLTIVNPIINANDNAEQTNQ
jgi:hypothetical protein